MEIFWCPRSEVDWTADEQLNPNKDARFKLILLSKLDRRKAPLLAEFMTLEPELHLQTRKKNIEVSILVDAKFYSSYQEFLILNAL